MDLRKHIFDIQMDNNYQECDTFDAKQGSVLDSLCRSHENLNYETTGGNLKPTASSNHQIMFTPLPQTPNMAIFESNLKVDNQKDDIERNMLFELQKVNQMIQEIDMKIEKNRK